MRDYKYKEKWKKLLTPEIVKIQSTEASNRIEGISTADDRLRNLVKAKTTPGNRDESQIAGYRDVLNTIHENYDYIPITS